VALDYVAAIKKTPIVVNDTRGFFVNRCVLRYMNESYNMLAEGVPPAMIENAAKMAGMPVGPLALNDEVAIDLSLKIVRATIADLGEKAVDPRIWSSSKPWSRRKAGWAARTARASTTIRRSPPRSIFGQG
jgi:3-hydroxyacyl-CoA dehydrogenase/enoyl-CoA hydratase/3-hydroxybutyryl-CoA epimerase